MRRYPWLVCGLVLLSTLAGCAAQSPVAQISTVQRQQLLSGTAAWQAQSVELLSAAEIMALDDDMRAFADAYTPSFKSHRAVEELVGALTRSSLRNIEYQADKTYSASDVFYYRQANCLSFAYLFVAMARQQGFRAQFQKVELPPTWASNGSTLVKQQHINVRVKLPGEKMTVEFNEALYDASYPRGLISDEEALAEFYNNYGVEALLKNRYAEAFNYFRAALELAPTASHLWVSFGVLYNRIDDSERAQWAFQQALSEEPGNTSAMLNLAAIYDRQGRQQLADQLAADAKAKRYSNPYYRYALAQKDYASRDYQAAIDHLQQALEKRKDHHFYHLLGINHWFLGDKQAAYQSLQQAAAVVAKGSDRERYQVKLDTLAANL